MLQFKIFGSDSKSLLSRDHSTTYYSDCSLICLLVIWLWIMYRARQNKANIEKLIGTWFTKMLVCERKMYLRCWIWSGSSIWNVVVFLQACILNYSCDIGYPTLSLCWSTVPDSQQVQADDWSSRADRIGWQRRIFSNVQTARR